MAKLYFHVKKQKIKVWSTLENYLNNQEIISGKYVVKSKIGFTVELMDVKAFFQDH